MKRNILWAALCMLSFFGNAQKNPPVPSAAAAPAAIVMEQWAAHPTIHRLADQYSKESIVVLQDIRRYEFVDRQDGVVVYKTLHKIIRMNDDPGIEASNRIYLGVSDTSDIVDIRARTILPGGKIIELDKHNIKDLKEENGNLYKIFAVEGLEKGCELEYYYTFKRYTTFFGKELVQAGFPILESSVEVLAPERLLFEMKAFNWAASASDTVLNGKRSVRMTGSDIPSLENEKYASYNANLRRVEFKLSHNTAVRNGNERLFTWNELAQRIYHNYNIYTPGELKAADEMIRSNKWDKAGDERAMIVAVENWVKKNYAVRENVSGENVENIDKFVKNRIASEKGITRLYGAIFLKLGIDYQLVLTCDRGEASIDRSFENWENTGKIILYFPATKKFLAPTLAGTRYPWIDPYWAGTDGLYCKNTTIGNFTTAVALIKPVPLEDYSQSYSNIESTVRLNPGKDTLIVDMKQSYGGYSAAAYRAGYNFSSADEQRQMIKDMVKFGTNSENIVSSSIVNADFESYSENKPFELTATVKTSELLETAGNKLLVRIGDIIGPQVEMYQEKTRQMPMELGYPHSLERTINLVIPDGYTVSNLDALNISHVYTDKGEQILNFSSSYVRDGNTIRINVIEQYRWIFYPLEQYVLFKQVINASADFNKIVLVLQKG